MENLHIKIWQRVLLLVALTLLWMGSITLTASAETASVNFDVINVRSGPGTSYDAIGSLTYNTSVEILEHSKGWAKISSGSINGWIAESLLNNCSSLTSIPPIQIFINGKLSYDMDPVSVNGCTLVPLGSALNNFGAAATFDNSSQTVTAQKFDKNISLTVGSQTAIVNGQDQTLDVPAQIVNGRAFVPLRLFGEALDCKITWDAETRHINISSAVETRGIRTRGTVAGKIITAVAVSITAADVNIRSGPSAESEAVGLAPNGTTLAYEGEKDGWYQVTYQGKSAWVAGWLTTEPYTAQFSSYLEEPVLLPVPSCPQDFVLQMKPYAEMASNGTGLPVNFLLAQWAEESGYGTSAIAQYYNNFGGIKDPNTGGFRRYPTAEDFAQDVIRLYTQNSNYNKLLADARAGASIQTLINDLSTCHYASSSSYGQKIKNSYLPEIDAALTNIK